MNACMYDCAFGISWSRPRKAPVVSTAAPFFSGERTRCRFQQSPKLYITRGSIKRNQGDKFPHRVRFPSNPLIRRAPKFLLLGLSNKIQ